MGAKSAQVWTNGFLAIKLIFIAWCDKFHSRRHRQTELESARRQKKHTAINVYIPLLWVFFHQRHIKRSTMIDFNASWRANICSASSEWRMNLYLYIHIHMNDRKDEQNVWLKRRWLHVCDWIWVWCDSVVRVPTLINPLDSFFIRIVHKCVW